MSEDKKTMIYWLLVLIAMCGGIGIVSHLITPIPIVWIISPIWETAILFLIILLAGFIKVIVSFIVDLLKSKREKEEK